MIRHRWSKPERHPSKTERTCLTCGLIKVTRHVDDGGQERRERGRPKAGQGSQRTMRDKNGRLVWVEWWKPAGSDGMPERLDVADGKTPACVGAPGARGEDGRRPDRDERRV